jgi:hypothetical protein
MKRRDPAEAAVAFSWGAMATDTRVQATPKVLNQVGHVHEVLKGVLGRDVRIQGVLTEPAVRAASLKWAAARTAERSCVGILRILVMSVPAHQSLANAQRHPIPDCQRVETSNNSGSDIHRSARL